MLGLNFYDLMSDTTNGVGYWPDPDGNLLRAEGTTMKQTRAWANMVDSRNLAIEQP